jgi:DNA-directed RNA polymerase specialized sigma24 family protein
MGRRHGREDDGQIFRVVYPALRRFALVVARDDADEVVQEAVARTLAARSLASLDSPLAYLRTAVVRVAMNRKRSQSRASARVARYVAGQDVAVDTYPSDLAELLRVPVKARALLYLTIVDGCTYAEAGAIVGLSEAAAPKDGITSAV